MDNNKPIAIRNNVPLLQALAKVQGAITGVKRDAINPHFKNRYATLENVIDTLRPALQDAGLVFVQLPGDITEQGCIQIRTIIYHVETGEQISTNIEVPLTKRDAQGAGSAITYGCRYSLMAMFGVPPTDDDGEGSIDRDNGQKAKSSYGLKKDNPNRWPEIEKAVRACKTRNELKELKSSLIPEVSTWPEGWRESLNEIWTAQYEETK